MSGSTSGEKVVWDVNSWHFRIFGKFSLNINPVPSYNIREVCVKEYLNGNDKTHSYQ